MIEIKCIDKDIIKELIDKDYSSNNKPSSSQVSAEEDIEDDIQQFWQSQQIEIEGIEKISQHHQKKSEYKFFGDLMKENRLQINSDSNNTESTDSIFCSSKSSTS